MILKLVLIRVNFFHYRQQRSNQRARFVEANDNEEINEDEDDDLDDEVDDEEEEEEKCSVKSAKATLFNFKKTFLIFHF